MNLNEIIKVITDISARLDGIERSQREMRSLLTSSATPYQDGTVLVQTIHGVKYFIDPNDFIMGPQMLVYRQWEADLSKFVLASVDKDSIFVDIGANFGYFTCLAGSKIGQAGSGQVISVEPNPKMYDLLLRNIQINWSMCSVNHFNLAVSDQDGYAKLVVPSSRAANARISDTKQGDTNSISLITETRRIDSITTGKSVDLMKIDIEGFETPALMGARETISMSPNITILMEWSITQIESCNFSPADLLDLIDNLGLSIYRIPETIFISHDEWSKLKVGREQLLGTKYDNILLRRMA